MAPKLYHIDPSPPARAVRCVANILGVQLDLEVVNLLAKEHFKTEFLKLNPTHTVPVLNDDGFIITDSHAILTYLVDKYAKSDELYPKDLKTRTLVNQFLHIDSGTFFARLIQAVRPLWTKQNDTIPHERLDAIREVYVFLEKFLEGKKFLVGNNLTIADICVATTLSSLECVLPLDSKAHSHVTQWFHHITAQEWYIKENTSGVEAFKQILKEYWKK